MVVGNSWWRYNKTLDGTKLGTLPTDTGAIWIADNSLDIVVVDYEGNDAYSYTPTTNTFVSLSLGFYPSSVCTLDTYFVFGEKDSKQFWVSDPLSTTVQSTRFASKEGTPDDLITLIGDKREVLLLGEKAGEFWYNEGDATFPLRRRAFMSHGTRAKESPAIVDNSIFFLDSHHQVRRIYGYDAQIISTRQIDYRIKQCISKDDAIGIPVVYQGHALYILIFPTDKKCFVYDASIEQWQDWTSLEGYEEIQFRVRCGLLGVEGGADLFNDKPLLGDYRDPYVWELSETAYRDGENRFRKSRSCMVISSEGKPIFFDRLQIEAETGVGLIEGVKSSTLADAGAADDTSVTVADKTGIKAGYGLEMDLDDGSLFATVVTGVVGNSVGLSQVLPSAASRGNAISFYDYEARFPTIDMDYSDDGGKTFSNKLTEELGGPGQYNNILVWTHMGSSYRRVFRWETDAPAKVIFSDAYLEATIGAR